jgi:hypothetical protein
MFDRVRYASKRALSGTADAAPDEATVNGLSGLLDDDESAEHALWSTHAFERTVADRTETMTPRNDGYAFALVSDRRMLFVVDNGDRSTPDSELSLAEVTAVEHRESLLGNSFSVETSDERVSFVPEGGDVETVATYLDRTAQRWRDLHEELDNAEELLEAYCDEDGMYDDIWRVGKQVRSHLKAADEVVTRYDDAVADRLATALEPVAADLAVRLRTEAEDVVDTVDVDDDGAENTYEQVRDVLEHARAIAVGPADLDVAPFEASLDSLDATIERSQWQWGGT